MKKNIFIAAVLSSIFLFGTVVYSLNKNQSSKTRTNSLLLKNIEALATGEDVTDGGEEDTNNIQCISKGSLDCPIGHVKVKYIISGYSLK